MKKTIIRLYRKIRSAYYFALVRRKIHSYGSVTVNGRFHISSTAKVDLGHHVNINGMRISGLGGAKIGNYFHSGTGVNIMLGSHDYDHDDAIPYGKHHVSKYVEIGDYVRLGTNCSICGNITIGEGAIVAYGAVVVKDVPPYAIVGGNPAKVIKYRDIEHFQTLKDQKKFN